jgi:hypothetical protein
MIFLIELISIHSLTNHSQKNWEIFSREKSTANWEIYHDIKNEKVAVIVENIQITEI